MKKLLFFLLLFPAISHAQKIQLSVMGGGSLSAIINDEHDCYKNSFSPNGRVKLTINTKVVSFGASADIFSVNSIYRGATAIIDPITGSVDTKDEKYSPLNPAFLFCGFVERQFKLKKASFFIGINGGYIFANQYSVGDKKYDYNGNGFSFGMQVGAAVPVYKRLSIIGEFSPRYIHVSVGQGMDIVTIPITAGLSYSF